MKLGIFAVSHKLPDWLAAGCAEYLKRLPKEFSAAVTEIKPEAGETKTRAQRLAAEKTRLLAASRACGRSIALDERGQDLTTRDLAARLARWQQDGGDTAFFIGGADGLDDAVKDQADETWRLSSLTLPHAMARLLLCEQLYRAISLLKNHPYHRE